MVDFLDTLATTTTYLLVALTAVEIFRGWLRERDRYRADLLFTVAVLVGILVAHATLLFLIQPVLLLRLVQRFRPVARWHWIVAIAGAVGGTAMSLLLPGYGGGTWQLIVCASVVIGLLGIGLIFYNGTLHVSGAGAQRLRWAAVGTWLLAATALALAVSIGLPSTQPWSRVIAELLGTAALGCYWVGLVGPRWLTAFWTHRQLYDYLQVLSERGPEERADHAPSDLARAATHSVLCSAAAVLLFTDDRSTTLTVSAAEPSSLLGVTMAFGSGLVSDAIRRGRPMIGPSHACEPALATAAARAGQTVAAVPIATGDHAWGALMVVVRTGSLFPEDDLRVLGELCRHTALSLSHSRVMELELERLRRETAVLRQERDARNRPVTTPLSSALSLDEPPRVLAVEDEDGVRDYLLALLVREGYRVTLATGHDDALAIAASARPFDLVVTDVMMPDGSGPALVRALRRLHPGLPAIFISGISREEFEEMAPGEERNFLQKPFEGGRLIGRIEALLQR